eukprot:m51a1_g219 putative protein xrp2 (354) ;mRNA; f:41632-43191
MGSKSSKKARKQQPAPSEGGPVGSAVPGSLPAADASAAPAATPASDLSHYTFSKQAGQVLVRAPGSIAGQRFIVEECTDCDIWLCDHMSTITFDECRNCRVFIGPVEGSCFVRTCKGCKFVAAVQQWRTRDCEDCDVLLHTTTEPCVESSSNIRFGCFRFSYQGLAEQFAKSGLDVFTNKWSEVYDFTPSPDSYSLLPVSAETAPVLRELPADVPAGDGRLVVPPTLGKRASAGDPRALVLFAGDGAAAGAMALASSSAPSGALGLALVRAKRFAKLDASAAAKLLGDPAHAKALWGGSSGPTDVIALEVCGDGAADKARAAGHEGAGFLVLSGADSTQALAKVFEADAQQHM